MYGTGSMASPYSQNGSTLFIDRREQYNKQQSKKKLLKKHSFLKKE